MGLKDYDYDYDYDYESLTTPTLQNLHKIQSCPIRVRVTGVLL